MDHIIWSIPYTVYMIYTNVKTKLKSIWMSFGNVRVVDITIWWQDKTYKDMYVKKN